MRAVLDTNVVMSAIFFGGVPFEVLSAWHNGEFELVVSDAVMAELSGDRCAHESEVPFD